MDTTLLKLPICPIPVFFSSISKAVGMPCPQCSSPISLTPQTGCTFSTLPQPVKEFKVMVIKMLTKLRRRMNEHSENCHKEIENIWKYQTEVIELKNAITELTNPLEKTNIRLKQKKETATLKKIGHLKLSSQRRIKGRQMSKA